MSIQTISSHEHILNVPVSTASFGEHIDLIMDWSRIRLSRYVCVSNVHMVMEAYWNSTFAEVLKAADLVTPDGMPLVWMLNILRGQTHDRVAGMDLMLGICQQASREGVGVYFLGTDALTLAHMRHRLKQEFPDLPIAGMEPLPFRPLTPTEDERLIQKVNQSQAGVIFVALGCPKQEAWMRDHKHRIQGVMIGVGGVFPVYAGHKKEAPKWVQKSGLEWFYRLIQEPGRLWKRYSTTIPPFIMLSAKQILASRIKKRISRVLSSRQPG